MGNFDSFTRLNQTEFFNHFNPLYDNERKLYDLLLTEAFNLHGVSLTYFVLSYDTTADKVLGEDNNRTILRTFEFMGNMELPRDTRQFSTMGVMGSDIFHIYSAKKHFTAASQYDVNGTSGYPEYKPRAGDLLRLSYNDFLDPTRQATMPSESPDPNDLLRNSANNITYYEIVSVKAEEEQFLQAKHSWDMIVRVYRDKSIPLSGTSGTGQNVESMFGDIWKYTNKNDLFDIGKFINETELPNSNKADIEYQEKPEECPPKDPFNNWWSDK